MNHSPPPPLSWVCQSQIHEAGKLGIYRDRGIMGHSFGYVVADFKYEKFELWGLIGKKLQDA